MGDSFSIDKFYSYLKNHKYKVNKNGNNILIKVGNNIRTKTIEIFVGHGADRTCISIKNNGNTEYMIYLHGNDYLAVTNKLCIELFSVNLCDSAYKNILNILEYLYGCKTRLLLNVAYLFEDNGLITKFVGSESSADFMYRNGQSVSRYNGYPYLESYGKHIGYVLTILNKDGSKKYLCISDKVANKYLDKYIDKHEAGNTIINIKYNRYFKIDESINETKLINIIKQL